MPNLIPISFFPRSDYCQTLGACKFLLGVGGLSFEAMAFGIIVHLLLLISTSVFYHGSCSPVDLNASSLTLSPIEGQGRGPFFDESRRKLGSFQICALCTCCDEPRRFCLLSPCCYAINCNIPNRPFGFCSFLPKACNCFDCSL